MGTALKDQGNPVAGGHGFQRETLMNGGMINAHHELAAGVAALFRFWQGVTVSPIIIWTAVAERSGDTAFARSMWPQYFTLPRPLKSAVAVALCRRTPHWA
jgi:hypothetical protein